MNLIPFKGIGRNVSPHTFTIELRTQIRHTENCVDCGAERPILAGPIPNVFTITTLCTDEDLERVRMNIFYIGAKFAITCNKVNHIIDNANKPEYWIISTETDWQNSLHEKHPHFERAMAAFIPRFAKHLNSRSLLIQ